MIQTVYICNLVYEIYYAFKLMQSKITGILISMEHLLFYYLEGQRNELIIIDTVAHVGSG